MTNLIISQNTYELVPCHYKYWDFVLSIRNLPENVSGFFSGKVSEEDHHNFMVKHSDKYRICTYKPNNPHPSDLLPVPIGWVGIVDDDIRICVDPIYKNQGIAKFMLNEFATPHGIATVDIKNEASHKLFVSCGYEPVSINYEKSF